MDIKPHPHKKNSAIVSLENESELENFRAKSTRNNGTWGFLKLVTTAIVRREPTYPVERTVSRRQLGNFLIHSALWPSNYPSFVFHDGDALERFQELVELDRNMSETITEYLESQRTIGTESAIDDIRVRVESLRNLPSIAEKTESLKPPLWYGVAKE